MAPARRKDVGGNKNSKEGRFSRLSKKLKKGAPLLMSDLSDDAKCVECPAKFQGFLFMKPYKNRRLNIAKRYMAKVSHGLLKLRGEKEVFKTDGLASEYIIDLAKVKLMSDDEHRRMVIAYRTEAHQITPTRAEDYFLWKETMHKHRLYRQSVIRLRGDEVSSDSMNTSRGTDRKRSSITTTSSGSGPHSLPNIDVDLTAVPSAEVRRILNMETRAMVSKVIGEIRSLAKEVKKMRLDFKGELKTLYRKLKSPTAKTKAAKNSLEEEEEQGSFSDVESSASTNEQPLQTIKWSISTPILSKYSHEGKDRKKEILHELSKVTVSRSLESIGSKSSAVTSKEKGPLVERRSSESAQKIVEEFQPLVKVPSLLPKIPPGKRRKILPKMGPPGEELGLSKIMAILACKASLPISFFEPLTMIQATCEELRYADSTLTKAVLCSDPTDRIALVTAFAVSAYASVKARKQKPFAPFLGETFDYISESGWKYHAEQVTLKPDAAAMHAEGPGWTWWQTFIASPKTSWNGVVELTPELPVRLRLGNEDYCWNKVKIIIEKAACIPEYRTLKIDGTMSIRCSNGCTSTVTFSKDKGTEITGLVYEKDGLNSIKLAGYWDKFLHRLDGERTNLFEAIPLIPNNKKYYGLTQFASGLNEVFPEEKLSLPSTDSRLRPDVKALEAGEFARAQTIKQLLEKANESNTDANHKVMWFEQRQDLMTFSKLWVTNGKYWPSKQKQFHGINIQPLFK